MEDGCVMKAAPRGEEKAAAAREESAVEPAPPRERKIPLPRRSRCAPAAYRNPRGGEAVSPAEMMVIVGPSGCGKTTLLRLIAGLERPDTGSIALHGRTVTDARVW